MRRLEKIIPCEIQLVINVSPVEFRRRCKAEIDRVVEEYNSHQQDNLYLEIKYNRLRDEKKYSIYIGKELIKENATEELEMIIDDLKDIFKYHQEKLKAVHSSNLKLIEQLKADRMYEHLYLYYKSLSDKKAFFYLKKLGLEFPRSDYGKALYRVYNSKNFMHKPNYSLAKKMSKSKKRDLRFF